MIINGVALDFGATDLAFSGTGIGTLKIQSFDISKKADVESVRDATGVEITRDYYNKIWEATWEGVISGTGLANALTQTILPEMGVLATSASTNYSWLNSLIWSVEDSQLKASNTKNKMVTLKLRYNPNITAVAPS
jgi:hypothetical protein